MKFANIASKLSSGPEQSQQNAQVALIVTEHIMLPHARLQEQGLRVAASVRLIDLLAKAGIDPKITAAKMLGKGVENIIGIGAQSVVYKVAGKDEVVKVCKSSVRNPEETDAIHERFSDEYKALKETLGTFVLDQEFIVDDVPYRGSDRARGLTMRQRFVSDFTPVLAGDYSLHPAVAERAASNVGLQGQLGLFAELSLGMMYHGDFYPDLFRPENLIVEGLASENPQILLIDNGALGWHADRDHPEGANERFETCEGALLLFANVA